MNLELTIKSQIPVLKRSVLALAVLVSESFIRPEIRNKFKDDVKELTVIKNEEIKKPFTSLIGFTLTTSLRSAADFVEINTVTDLSQCTNEYTKKSLEKSLQLCSLITGKSISDIMNTREFEKENISICRRINWTLSNHSLKEGSAFQTASVLVLKYFNEFSDLNNTDPNMFQDLYQPTQKEYQDSDFEYLNESK